MADHDVQQAELRAMREDISDMKRAMHKMAEAFERLARLEERHVTASAALERAFGVIAKIDARVAALELAQPVQKLTSSWVVNMVWGAGGMLAMAVFKKMGVL